MKKGEWVITIKMNQLHVLRVDIKTRNGEIATAVDVPVPHGQPFVIPIQTVTGEVNFLMEMRGCDNK